MDRAIVNRGVLETVPSARFKQLAARVGVPRRELDDVVQEMLLRVWEKRAQIDASDNPPAYITRIALNEARYHVRAAQSTREVLTAPEGIDLEDERPGPEEHEARRRRIAVLWRLIDQLDPRVRDVFIAHDLLGQPLADVAAAYEIPLTTAEKRLQRAWREVREARNRWQAEQRRRGEEVVPAFLPVLGQAQLRDGLDRVRRALRGTTGKAIGWTALLAVVMAEHLLPITGSPHKPAQLLGSARASLLAACAAVPKPIAAPCKSRPHEADPPAAPAQPAPTGQRSIEPSAEAELGLIAGARAALRANTAAGNVEARRLLEEHAREFPEGRLAPEREALLASLR